jgi:hypothetical protein
VLQQTHKTHEKEKFCRRAPNSNPLEPHLLLVGARLFSLSLCASSLPSPSLCQRPMVQKPTILASEKNFV